MPGAWRSRTTVNFEDECVSDAAIDLAMPAARDFGWELKPASSCWFEIDRRSNGQLAVVMNHALLRGVRAEMVHWWFLHFPRLRVRLVDVPGYEDRSVPAYLLWHPSDHYAATLSGTLGPENTSRRGASITIQEAMQYERYGWKYPVNTRLRLHYVGDDGWAMGRSIPILGPVMMLRIHYKDAYVEGEHVGTQYHYEVVVGLSGGNPIARAINRKVTAHFGAEFFEAWRQHNVHEVGAFENFLPALYAQRDRSGELEYRREMNPDLPSPASQTGFDRGVFERRLQGFRDAADPLTYQAYGRASFL